MATQSQRIDALESGIESILAMLKGEDNSSTPKGTTKRTPKGKQGKASDVGRESTFPLANLVAYQGVDESLAKGETFTYNRAKGKGTSTWKVTKVTAGIVHAVKVS